MKKAILPVLIFMKFIFVLLVLLLSYMAKAPQAKSFTKETPFLSDGIEYGYSIKNVSIREVSNKDFSRYEVTLYATNKSECSQGSFVWSEYGAV